MVSPRFLIFCFLLLLNNFAFALLRRDSGKFKTPLRSRVEISLFGTVLANDKAPAFNSTTPAVNEPPPVTSETLATPTEDPRFKPHIESSASDDGFQPDKPKPATRSTPPPDVGSLIQSFLDPTGIVTFPDPFVKIETSVTGFGSEDFPGSGLMAEPTDTWDGVWPTESGAGQRPHVESSADGIAGDPITPFPQITGPRVTPPPVTLPGSKTLEPVPVTNIQVGDKTLTPGGETATIGDGPSATYIHIDPSGQPIVVVGSSTSTVQLPVSIGDKPATPIPSGVVIDGQTLTSGGSPITIGSGFSQTTLSIDESGHTIAIAEGATSTLQASASQTFAIGQLTATAVANNYQYAIGSSTLGIGQSVTVDGTVIALTTDSAGATVLVAGGTSTTLAPAAGTGDLSISTLVVSGTTQYVINGQTLAPGHPITIDGKPMSITTSGGSTILVIGDKTTTLSGQEATTMVTTELAAATPGSLGGGTAAPSSTSKKGAAEKSMRSQDSALVSALGMLIVFLGFG